MSEQTGSQCCPQATGLSKNTQGGTHKHKFLCRAGWPGPASGEGLCLGSMAFSCQAPPGLASCAQLIPCM